MLLLSTLAPAQAAVKTDDPGRTGPYAVGFTSYVLTDPSREGDGDRYEHRPIPMYVWYPVDHGSINNATELASYPLDPLYQQRPNLPSAGLEVYGIDRAYQDAPVSAGKPFPVVMFSPGWGAPPWLHVSIAARLASHGFIVAVPYHFGDGWWPWEPVIYQTLTPPSFHRPRDVSFALDDLTAKNATQGHLLRGAANLDQLAAGGWSLGGYAAMVLAGGDDDVCDAFWDQPPEMCVPSKPDPRIKAIVPLDGSGWILWFNELARIKVPAIGIGQEWDGLLFQVTQGWAPEGWESWAARQHAAYSGRPAYRVDVYNSNHFSFADFCQAIPALGDMGLSSEEEVAWFLADCAQYTPSDTIHRITSQYAIAFLKTHLSGATQYQQYLTPGWTLTREPLAEFFVTEKRSPQSITEDWPGSFIYFKHQSGSEQAKAAKDPAAKPALKRISAPGH
jgi:hypothetical protein